MRRRRLIGLLLIALLCLPLTACESMSGSDYMLLMELIYGDWGNAKGTNPRNEEGQIDPVKAAGAAVQTGKQELLGTGNEDADAALSALGITGEVRPWDSEVTGALKTGDETKINEAIVLNPDDHHYRNALGVLQLIRGDDINAKNAFTAGTEAYQRSNPKHTAETANPKLIRDRLSLINQAIANQGTNGSTPAGQAMVRNYYCTNARTLKTQYGDAYWLDKTSIDCARY
ncbi:MAG: hypothetical protein BWY10_02353 [Chloroflexi bacterium ADurb.Bin180]|nr:MAG: hypothetical protein BWY10_02353 [Chloroflexi bacterium ADurb.Bin180]